MTKPKQTARKIATKSGETSSDERISLHGHDPEDVLKALLKVDPDSEPVEPEGEPGPQPKPGEKPSKP